MEIKNKLTLQFTAIVFLLLLLFSCSIYYVAYITRYNNFNQRLTEKALNTVKMLLEVDQIDERLLKNLRRNYLSSLPGEFVRIYDYNNKLVFMDDTVRFFLTPEQLNQVKLKGSLSFKVGDRQVVAVNYINKYIITSSAINVNGEEQLSDLRSILLIGNLITLFIITIAGRFFAIQSLKPIAKIIHDVEKINEVNLNLRLDEGNRKDEISQLALSFNKLFNRLQNVFEKQNRFVANASHELRTPLTSITGEIEVTLMKEREKEEYVAVLSSVLEEAKVLTKLSNGLLQLAQTGHKKLISVSEIELILFVEDIYDEVKKRHPQKSFIVKNKIYESIADIVLSGNKDLLKIAFINVIENAFKFSDNQPVNFDFTVLDEYVEFYIKDKGIGLYESEYDLITSPFYRSNNAASIEGNGIGLSLTNKIIKLHEGTLKFNSVIGKGTEVIIKLPCRIIKS